MVGRPGVPLPTLEKWRFHIVIESFPAMLQLALLYLWTVSRTVAGAIPAITLFGVTSYIFLTLVATFYFSCPYQTPPSVFARTVIEYLPLTTPLPYTKNIGQTLRNLCHEVRSVVERFGYIPAMAKEAERTPIASVVVSPTQIFKDVSTNWEICKADVRCICWVLDSTTDTDAILSTTRFAADMIWYPEIAGTLSPHILAGLFFDYLLDGRTIPGKLGHTISIGMVLASVLNVQPNMEPEDEGLKELRKCIDSNVQRWWHSSEPMFMPATNL
ncbi:hypothetical protein BDM02DRAFT_3272423 [Thelephora ganbajun]|uniref:Uncharacterized protein n=1 Tax=Thelephora ganbajun TaxID=370292 RepID=A0ACB6Z4J6_THEGA|nr:hypothetical protein BDM02DRAFT_3272423 [Thelephora ganbajun]